MPDTLETPCPTLVFDIGTLTCTYVTDWIQYHTDPPHESDNCSNTERQQFDKTWSEQPTVFVNIDQ